MSNVTLNVDGMTDYQILFAANIFKAMKTTPEVDWKEVGEALSIEPDFAKTYCEAIRNVIAIKKERKERFAENGEIDTNPPFTATVDPLEEKDCEDACPCDNEKKVLGPGVDFNDDNIEAQLEAAKKLPPKIRKAQVVKHRDGTVEVIIHFKEEMLRLRQ